MSANRAVTLALAAGLALAGPPLLAQRANRGGGPRGGGGHPGRSYAVPRGSAPVRPGYAPRAGVAAGRHPQAGRYSGHPGYGYGGHYPRHGYYPPHYGGRYYGYYRPYAYGYPYAYPYAYPWVSLSFGWPYAAAGWPYGYYAPSYGVYYRQPGAVLDAPPPREGARDAGRVRLEVRPDDASVYVDDEFRGDARDARSLTLRSGRHTIEIVRPGFEVERREVEVVRGERSDVLVEMRRP